MACFRESSAGGTTTKHLLRDRDHIFLYKEQVRKKPPPPLPYMTSAIEVDAEDLRLGWVDFVLVFPLSARVCLGGWKSGRIGRSAG